MPLLAFLLLLIAQILSGYGILTLLGLRLRTSYALTLSILLGIALSSFLPFLLQLCWITLTGPTIFGSLAVAALLLNIPAFLRIRREGLPAVVRSFRPGPFRFRVYEVPFFLVMAFFLFISIWRCYYLPPLSRDALSGPEAIAEFAVREHTMINSFFRVDLWSTNNPYKSPYLVSLQMIYKLAGFPFGQIWLSVVVVCFTVFLYQAVKEKVHPVLAGLLVLLLTMAPELYAYTFMILYDYSNMVFFFLSLYFLFGWFREERPTGDALFFAERIPGTYYCSVLLMGIATYIRSETLVLALFFLPLIGWRVRGKYSAGKISRYLVLFVAPSLLAYYLTVPLYLGHYIPIHYKVAGEVNAHLSNLGPLFQRYRDIVTRLFTGVFAVHLWGYILYVFAALFLAELILLRRLSKEACNWLYAIAALYIGVGFLGWLLPLMNLNETTKRSLFKLLPLIVLYLANNGWLIRLSGWISHWEQAKQPISTTDKNTPKPALARANPSARTTSSSGANSKKKKRK